MSRDKVLVLVRFIQKNAPYNTGETAGFPAAIAQRFIEHGKAVLHEPMSPKSEEKPKAKVVETKTSETAADPVAPIHDKGPFFMVGDQRVRGKKAAQALADELNAKATPQE
jgi:hypothetical protein